MRHKKNAFITMLSHFWAQVLHLPFGRRLIFFSSVFTIVSLFFPFWFTDGKISFSAFEKTSVFAEIIMIFSLFSLLIVLREIFSHSGTLGGISHGKILIFLFGQSLYTVVLANFSLSVLLLEKSTYSINTLGTMLTFLSLGVGLAGAIFSKNFSPYKAEKKHIFEEHDINISSSEILHEKNLSLGDYEDK